VNVDALRALEEKADSTRPRLAWNAKSVADHRSWRRAFRRKLVQLLGANPERVPLKIRWEDKIETPRYVRQKVFVQSEKDYWIPAYYFVPKKLKAPAPAILCFHGHGGIGTTIREGGREQMRRMKELSLDNAAYFADNGYVTLAPVQRGWADGVMQSECHRLSSNAFMTGRTAVGMRVWDAMRLFDFLETRKEADPKRMAAAGLSGGGTTGLFFSALDDRVKLAMIAGYYCTFRDSVFDMFHCICNCVPGIMDWCEMREIAALIAPRPLLVIAGKKDPIFPIKATRKACKELSDVYGLLKSADCLEKDFFDGPHAWSNRKTLPFLRKHFGN
jgi:dienelactone hydrolase